MSFIHDPDFEIDFIEDYSDDVMTFSDKFESLYCMYLYVVDPKTEFIEPSVGAYFRDLMDLMDETDDENDEEYHRKSLYLFFKSLAFPFGKKFMELHKTFLEECVRRAEYSLDYIKEHHMTNSLWNNTRKMIADFLSYEW